MPSPFPGMDPYLEAPGLWPDVHDELISAIRNLLNRNLPAHYHARTRERVYISDETDPGREFLIPDVHVRKVSESSEPAVAGASAAVAEPLTVTTLIEEEIKELYVEVVHLEDAAIVTVIEVLSPSNKSPGARGHDSYHTKRLQIMHSDANLVEIDLLRSGRRVPIVEEMPACEYMVHVSRADTRPQGTVWPIRLEQPLPSILVPLRPPDGDCTLDLQGALNDAYERGAYNRVIDYHQAPAPPCRRGSRVGRMNG